MKDWTATCFVLLLWQLLSNPCESVCFCFGSLCIGRAPCREPEPAPAPTPVVCPVESESNYTSWESTDGQGQWVIEGVSNTVSQSTEGLPTFFCDPTFSPLGYEINFTITAPVSASESYFGWAFGYINGYHVKNETAEYILLDWKRGNTARAAFPGCSTTQLVSRRGLALSRVKGTPHPDELFQHRDDFCVEQPGSVEELARASTLGDIDWAPLTPYNLSVVYTTTNVQVYVADTLQINKSGTFPDGNFCFYSFASANALYGGLRYRNASCAGDPL